MLTYRPGTPEQYDEFLQMIWDDGREYMEIAMGVIQMTWEEYAQFFRTRGVVQAICQDNNLAGFYWIEEREDTLHLHGLILKSEFQGHGIGTAVLSMLADRYTGRLDRIELGVYQKNTGAIKLYEKMGYCITKTLTDPPFHIMQKPLTQNIA
jgi:ribosomal protein S18 acetylase RimI-like enzyme